MVVKTIQEAVDRARADYKPTLIEAITYRVGAHSSSDDPTRYRSAKELEEWKQYGPLVRMIAHATWRKIWTKKLTDATIKDADATITKIFEACEPFPPPPPETLFHDVYATIPASLQSQKEQHLDYLRGETP